MKQQLLLLALFAGCLFSCENKEDAPTAPPVITFSESHYELEAGTPYVISGTITAATEILSVKLSEVRSTGERALTKVSPNATSYSFTQEVTPSTATTGLKVVATVQGGLETTETVPITVGTIAVPIPVEDLYGHFEVQRHTIDGEETPDKVGDVWEITSTGIEINCSETFNYTFSNNVLTMSGVKYTIGVLNEPSDGFTFTTTVVDVPDVITLIWSSAPCPPVLPEISLIQGRYEVQSYVNNGAPDASRVNEIWEITETHITAGCTGSAQTYTYNPTSHLLVFNGVTYEIGAFSQERKLAYTFTAAGLVITLVMTDRSCTDDPYVPPTVGDVELDRLYGWAAYGNTTGGAGGAVYHFNDGVKFGDWLLAREKAKSTAPAVVWLSGAFTKEQGTRKSAGSPWYDIKRTSNITIIGTDNFRMQNIGFFLNEATNIIIRNVYIVMPKADNGADGISMQESYNVWVDHCTFESVNQTKDYEDGSCDITHATYNVTVSWCHYIKTQKSSLVGHSNSASADVAITATFHHNYFDRSSSRHPRVRFGRVHVYNNFFNQVSTYGVGSAYEAKVLVEQNYFDNVHLPTDICTYPAKSSGSNLEGSVAGYLFATDDNVYANKPSNASNPYPFTNVEYKSYGGAKISPALTYNNFKPSYDYTVDAAGQLATIVPNGAGVGKLGYRTAPIEVDNGGLGTDPGTDDPNDDPDEPGDSGLEIGNDWKKVDVGTAAGVYAILDDGSISLAGKGKLEGSKQVYTLVYREITGDFILTAQLNSYTSSGKNDNQARAGLLYTSNITDGTPYVINGKAGDGTYYVTKSGNSRETLAAPSTQGSNVYLKLERSGDTYHASYSLDGGNSYGNASTGTLDALPDKLYVGIAVNSGDNSAAGTAIFSNIKIDGNDVPFSDE
jgi:pectate lyase